MASFSSVVLAGSARFANALLSPLATGIGVWPSVAADPRRTLELCQAGPGLLVLEYRGPEWLQVARDLRHRSGGGLGIVVALAPEDAGTEPRLAGAADAVVRWDGRPESVLEAVERLEARPAGPASRPAPPAAAPAAPAPGRARPAPPPAPRAASAASRDALSFDIDEHVPAETTAPAAAGGLLLSFERSGLWPGNVISAADAEGLLAGLAAGLSPGADALRASGERVYASLTALEKDALRGAAIPVDAGLVARAAALRWRVSEAIASAPPPDGPVDGPAVRALLAEVDAVLSALKQAGENAPAQVQPELERVRNALVREAIDLTEAVQRFVRAPAPAAVPAPARAAARAATRVLTVSAPSARDRAEARRPRALYVVLGIAVLAALAFHGYRFLVRSRAAPAGLERFPGAPANVAALPGVASGPRPLVTTDGKPPSAQALETFRDEQALRGNEVREVAPGAYLVVPAGRGARPAGASGR